jgi:DUF4097 and DUF4098 domain-containing protein YvlB
MKKSASLLGVVLFAGHASLFAQADRYALSGDRVAIFNLAGEVRLEPGKGENVVIELSRGGRDQDRLEVRRSEESGWQQLIVRYPSKRIAYERMGRGSRTEFRVHRVGTFGLRELDPQIGTERIKSTRYPRGGGERVRLTQSDGLEAYADIRVLVPTGRVVSVHLGAGKVFVANVEGDIQIDARSATIEAWDVSGFGRLDTGSGAVHLSNATGDFAVNTGSGSVVLKNGQRGAFTVKTGSGSVQAADVAATELDIDTGSGSVTLTSVSAPIARVVTGSGGIRALDFETRNFDLHTGSGAVRAELAADIQVGRVRTGSGSVELSVSKNLGAEVLVDTGSGGIGVNNAPIEVAEMRRGYLRGSIGDGAGTLRISTGSGGVSFRSY